MNFKDLKIIEPIMKALDEKGYSNPTKIQQLSIPIILSGSNLIGCAQTGTGKTASFAIPILQLLSSKKTNNKSIRTLILTPTRELAIQIEENFKWYAKNLPIKSKAIFGGVNINNQIQSLANGMDVLIATPGRLLDLVSLGRVKLNDLEIFVLDEADRMLDIGFLADIKKVVKLIPSDRQTLLFSATMPPSIKSLASSILKNPKEVSVVPESTTADKIKQSVYFVEKDEKLNLLSDILLDNKQLRSLIFTRTKHGADKLVKKLAKEGLKAMAIHGNKSQNARQKALTDFKDDKIQILIATDIAARGIDISELPLVINYELPNIPETYVHRIGRTGRANFEGEAISFCSTEEKKDLLNIQKLIRIKIPVNNIN